MSSKSASSSSRKKTSKSEPDSAPKKIKVPSSFIVRPSVKAPLKYINCLYVQNGLLEAMELQSGSFVYVQKDGMFNHGFLATIHEDENITNKKVVQVSTNVRKYAGILLGDRVSISKYTKQPGQAESVVISCETSNDDGDVAELENNKVIEKTLNDVGLIYPGLELTINETAKTPSIITLRIIDISAQDSLTESFEKLEVHEDGNSDVVAESDLYSPSFIFIKGRTSVSWSPQKEPSMQKYPYIPKSLSYDEVGGLSKQISVLQSTIQLPLHNPQLFSDFGISPPRGILLHGPPGTGKTMLLRCIAHNSKAHILTVNGPSIVSKYLGETENSLRDIFQEAAQFQPAIIFMDEIDSLTPNRNSDDSGETESRVVATLLTLMDGMSQSGRIVIVGATNRPNSIDPALRRPGRFDQELEIGIPDIEAREQILRRQLNKMNPDKVELTEDDIKVVAGKTHGYVGADISALCREAVMITINKNLTETTTQGEIKLGLDALETALMDITPSAMREIFLEMPKVYWSDIGGQAQLKQKLMEVVQLPLEAASAFRDLGVKAPKGVLLYGPPGCSKTLAAKALATESGLNFLAIKGPEILNKYVGESERAIREIFRKARAASPSIIFFDEIDSISGDREDSGTTASQNVLISLLNEIDGVEELKGVVIIAATNRPTEIDPALLRPGRLDRHIYVGPPDFEARIEILRNCCAKFDLSDTENLFNEMSTLTEGCSGAEVSLLCQEAGLAAIMESKDARSVERKHFMHALEGISRGITREMLSYYSEFSRKTGLNI